MSYLERDAASDGELTGEKALLLARLRAALGQMVHTRFFSTEEQAREAFDAMKIELGQILHMAEEAADFEPERRLQIVSAAISRFIDRFPV